MNTALIIDIAYIDRAVIRLTLERLGVSVFECGTMEDGVRETRLRLPELVFADTSMSVYGGGEVINRLHAASPDSRIVAIASWVDEQLRLCVRHAGAAALLERPLTPSRVRYAAALATPVTLRAA